MTLPRRAPAVCAKLAAGMTLDAICAEHDMPKVRTIHRWLANHPEFRARYAQARRLQADRLADQILEIADGVTSEAGEAEVRRDRLRIEARKWAVNQLAEPFELSTKPEPVERIFFFGADDPSEAISTEQRR